MATAAVASKGTALKMGDAVTPTEGFVTIAEILNISGPSESVATIDATSMDSTAKEFISSALPDGGEVTFECHFLGSNTKQQALRTDMRAGTRRNFKLELPDTTTVTFAAFVTAMGPDMPAEGKVTQSVTLRVTGLPTWSYAV